MTETDEDIQSPRRPERSPGAKFLLVLLTGFLLAIPLFASWLLIYDRQNQSEQAEQSIVTGWGGQQVFAGPKIVLPYKAKVQESVEQDGKTVTRTNVVTRELYVSPEVMSFDSDIQTEVKSRSIYEVVIYNTNVTGSASFKLPEDFDRSGIDRADIDFARAEIRFGLSDARGLSADNKLTVDGQSLVLQPGKGLGETGNTGFFAWLDATALAEGEMAVNFDVKFRGTESLTMVPDAGQTNWSVTSQWPHPSFTGGFLPDNEVSDAGFTAKYGISNLALGSSLTSTQAGQQVYPQASSRPYSSYDGGAGSPSSVTVNLIQPVDLYDQVSRATKYGFLFIGFTFVAFLLFDLIGGVRISSVQYILVGVALVLFFILLLAFAEIIGFALAYVVASVGIIGLITAYAASVLSSWRRASIIGGLLAALYGVIYILLSLEAYSLLIGSLLIFAALAGVMFVTRRLDWSRTLQRGPAT
ncbi:cell envelope integrity protein CreD [Parasphingorhabdus litoris]|uniref:Cell envelope integrity protein CreD n=1 Tax=Parasphingorhabdus litoris TaxID=394733 RepID=A0ABP3K3K3_9SPHN|nr:cell envelope integrity protein CreD [Parasphingorhabdus litoris]